MRPALVVGLTGGIASGKSTVAQILGGLAVPVIDADEIARELVEPGQPALSEIVKLFGNGVLGADGRLDRPRLRERVFQSTEQRNALEALLHPRILEEMKRHMEQTEAPYCVLCIPLLVETGQAKRVDRILVVDIAPELQLQRLRERDGTSRQTAEEILRVQADRERRLAAAHDVIDNSSDREQLRENVLNLHRKYLKLATSRFATD